MRSRCARGPCIGDVGEAYVVARIRAALDGASGGASGVGDDAALVRLAKRDAIVSTDMLVENVDFRLSWASFADIGAKAAMVNLSDVAAMGAAPHALLISIAAGRETRHKDVVALVRAADAVGRPLGAPVVGGDLSEIDGPLTVSVTAVGSSHHALWRRHRGRVGDVVCVTGTLGAAAAGLCVLETPQRFDCLSPRARTKLVQAQRRPVAPVTLAPRLAARGCVRSAADLSDGLMRDALHVVPPRAGIVLDTTRLPLCFAVLEAARCLGHTQAHAQACRWALGGGEDFGLVMALSPGDVAQVRRVCQTSGTTLTPVGRITSQRGVRLWPAKRSFAVPPGCAHFGARARG